MIKTLDEVVTEVKAHWDYIEKIGPVILWSCDVPIIGRADAVRNARRVLTYLAIRAHDHGGGKAVSMYVGRIENELGMPRQTIYSGLKRLEDQGIIARTRERWGDDV